MSKWKSQGGNKSAMAQIRWLPCRNAYAGDVPAFGLVQVTGADKDGTLIINRPSEDGQLVAVVGPHAIANANGDTTLGRGICTFDSPVFTIYDNDDGDPVVYEMWGAGKDSFMLRKGRPGFIINGAVNNSTNFLRVQVGREMPDEMVEVVSTVPDGDGYLDAYICYRNPTTKVWTRAMRIWALDANL